MLMTAFAMVADDGNHFAGRHHQKLATSVWLGQTIANWTGIVTEMDKIGGPGSQASSTLRRLGHKRSTEQLGFHFSEIVIDH